MARREIIHEVAHGSLIKEIVANGFPAQAVQIYKGRNRLFCLDDADGTAVNIKAFHCPRFPNNYVYTTLRDGKAKRSFENANRLLSLGFGTPRPYGYGEVRSGLRMTRSYYFCEQLDAENVRDWERFDDCEEMLAALGEEMVRLHRAGVWHKDFSPGNILFKRLPGGRYRFYYIDLNRMEFGIKSRKSLMSMFRAINLDEHQTARLARHYAAASGEDVATVVAEAVGQLRDYQADKKKHRFFKKLVRFFNPRK